MEIIEVLVCAILCFLFFEVEYSFSMDGELVMIKDQKIMSLNYYMSMKIEMGYSDYCVSLCSTNSTCSAVSFDYEKLICDFYNSTNLIFEKDRSKFSVHLKMPSNVIKYKALNLGADRVDLIKASSVTAFSEYSCYYKCLDIPECYASQYYFATNYALFIFKNECDLYMINLDTDPENALALFLYQKVINTEIFMKPPAISDGDIMKNTSLTDCFYQIKGRDQTLPICYYSCMQTVNCKAFVHSIDTYEPYFFTCSLCNYSSSLPLYSSETDTTYVVNKNKTQSPTVNFIYPYKISKAASNQVIWQQTALFICLLAIYL